MQARKPNLLLESQSFFAPTPSSNVYRASWEQFQWNVTDEAN